MKKSKNNREICRHCGKHIVRQLIGNKWYWVHYMKQTKGWAKVRTCGLPGLITAKPAQGCIVIHGETQAK